MLDELETRAARDACAAIKQPRAFVLIGQGGPNVIDPGTGRTPYVIDAEGIVLRSGAVYAWCHAGCCDQRPRRWPSVDAAADFHGSTIVDGDGLVRAPGAGRDAGDATSGDDDPGAA